MTAYATAAWQNFFVAEAGAAAALTGLLFVTVSINLRQILGAVYDAWVLLVEIIRQHPGPPDAAERSP